MHPHVTRERRAVLREYERDTAEQELLKTEKQLVGETRELIETLKVLGNVGGFR